MSKAVLGAMMPIALLIACFIGAVMNHPASAAEVQAVATATR